MGESVLMALISMVIAVLLGQLLLPFFNNLSGKEFEPSIFNAPRIVTGLIIAIFLIGMIAGSYPAFYLSYFKPIRVLSGETRGIGGNLRLRKILVVFQFSISIALIISTLVVFGQWRFLSNKKLGVNPENVIIVRRPSSNYYTFKQEVLKNPRVINVTSSNKKPTGGLTSNLGYKAEGLDEDSEQSIKIVTVDFDFFETLENRILLGRSFSKEYSMDSVSTFILNETAVRDIGWEDPLGKWFETSTLDPVSNNWKKRRGLVVGVSEDFHFESIHNTIQPVCYFVDNFWVNWMSIRISSEDFTSSLQFLEREYNKLNPDFPFDYSFYDEDIEALYESERQFFRLFIVFALLAIFIACLGILGLASYTAEQRTKEIGIRKVAGASVNRIILLVTNEFTRLVLIANIIAWPVAWYFMRNWIQNFPYRIKLGIYLFVISALLAFLFAQLMVVYQAWRAATRNPADALRYE
jgi:ABC-type antimicrobial peptide transport system permease subunit